MPKLIDLTGQQFNRITILERDYETQKIKKSKEVYWKCKCMCGTIFSARGHDIKNNKVKSCGCLRKEKAHSINYKDITNQRFGKLVALYPTNYVVDHHTVWHCKCDCGNEVDIMGKNLRNGQTQSCGCLKSLGEEKIIHLLISMGIPFETQKSFNGCINKLPLKFDFYLPKNNVVIEYQGSQHFQPINFFGGEERFINQQKADNIKREWCKKNNIGLIEIPYKDFSILDESYLQDKIKSAQ